MVHFKTFVLRPPPGCNWLKISHGCRVTQRSDDLISGSGASTAQTCFRGKFKHGCVALALISFITSNTTTHITLWNLFPFHSCHCVCVRFHRVELKKAGQNDPNPPNVHISTCTLLFNVPTTNAKCKTNIYKQHQHGTHYE